LLAALLVSRIAYVWPLARPWLAAALSAVAGMALGVRVAARRGPLAPEQPPSHDRLFHETQTLSAELQALVNSSREFSATLDIPALAASVVQRLHRAASARAVALYEWNPENNTLHRLAYHPPEVADQAQRLLETHHAALVESLGSPRPITLALDGGAHRASALPLVARERPVGLAVLWDQPAERELPGAQRLVEGMIHQAAVALQNAQTYSRADASLRERVIELSAIEVISRHMSATLDLETIINDVVAAAMSAIDAAIGCCGLVLDDERFMLVAMLDQSGAQPELPIMGHVSQGLTGRVLREHRPFVTGDVLAEPGGVPLFDGMRSELCVPIMREGRPIGLLVFEDPRSNAFTEAHMRFVGTLAEHAAIAIENARLFTDRRRQIETLVSLRRISTQLLAATRLETVAETILRYVTGALHAECAFLYWISDGGETGGARLAGAQTEGCPLSGDPDDFVWQAAQSGQPYYSVDAGTLPAYHLFMPLRDFEARACVPIRRGDHTLGVLDALITDSHYYTPNEVQALEVIATQAAVAVESIRLNEAIRAGRDQLQAILDSTREGMLLFDLEGRLLRANRAAEDMLEQPLAEAQGRSYIDWLRAQRPARVKALTGHTLPELRRYLQEVMRDPTRVMRRQFVQQRESGPRTIDETGSPVLDERGETVIGWMLVWHDITEERRLDDLRQELSSMIVHDLRSPLTAIISSLTLLDDLLAEESVDRLVMREVISIASASGETMLRLVESLLDIARLEQNRIALDLGAYRLRDVVDSAYASVLSLALEAGITIDTHLPDDLPPVWIDGEQIHRVLVNLLDNALRHTPAHGSVLVHAERMQGGDTVCVSVCDSGPGIPAGERGAIFDKFTQLDHPVLRGHKGSGLGLTFCKLVIEAHGGQIWVDDDAALGGAAFHFSLSPARRPAPRTPAALLDGHDMLQDTPA
jgi:PAS domain S-box-containing protein